MSVNNPFAPHCADWSYGLRTPTADCIGLVLWCSGIDRYQPTYHGSLKGWLNCLSLLDDADGAKVWCRPVLYSAALPGDWLITNDHIGIIVRPACYLPDHTMTSDHLVVDCSPRHGRPMAVNTGYPWSSKCRVVRIHPLSAINRHGSSGHRMRFDVLEFLVVGWCAPYLLAVVGLVIWFAVKSRSAESGGRSLHRVIWR